MTIFNNRDVVVEIGNIRKEVMDFYRKVENVMCYNGQLTIHALQENILRGDRMMLDKYVRLGIRHPHLDIFERDARTYREI